MNHEREMAWREATGCSTPGDARCTMEGLLAEAEALKRALGDAMLWETDVGLCWCPDPCQPGKRNPKCDDKQALLAA